MKMRIVVHTPLGIFESTGIEANAARVASMDEMLENLGKLAFLALDGLNGRRIFISGQILKESVAIRFIEE